MKKKKRILVFAKNVDGGTGTFLSQFLKIGTVTEVEKIRVLVLKKPQFFVTETGAGIEVVYYSGPILKRDFYDLSWRTLLTLMHEAIWFKHQIDQFNPNVIVALDTHCCLFVAVLTQVWHRNARTILTFHNNIGAVTFYKLSKPARWLLRILCGIFLNRAGHIVSISHGAVDDLKKYFFLIKPVQHIPYGLNLPTVKKLGRKDIESQDKPFFRKGKINVISIGRFAPQKDFFTLIRAFKLVKKLSPRRSYYYWEMAKTKKNLLPLRRP